MSRWALGNDYGCFSQFSDIAHYKSSKLHPGQTYSCKCQKSHLQLTARAGEDVVWQLSYQPLTLTNLWPLHPLSHLRREERQADEGEEHPEVLLPMLDVVAHPHHQSLEDGLLVGDVDVIAGEQLNNLSRGEQQELLVLNDLQEVFLEHRGDVEEADNHQSLAEGHTRCSLVCLCL